MPAMSGKVAVLTMGPSAEAVARRLAAAGMPVVLVAQGADEAAAAGRLATAIESSGTRRPALFVLDDATGANQLDALVELLGELFA